MIRLKLLLATVAVVLMATAAERPAHSSCILTGLCRACNPAGTAKQPCKFNPCTGEYICGSCTNHCVPPP